MDMVTRASRLIAVYSLRFLYVTSQTKNYTTFVIAYMPIQLYRPNCVIVNRDCLVVGLVSGRCV